MTYKAEEFNDVATRLRFLVEFAGLDLEALTKPKWRRLHRSLFDCVLHGRKREGWMTDVPPSMRWCEVTSPRQSDNNEQIVRRVKSLQAELMQVFEDQANSDNGEPPLLFESRERRLRFYDDSATEGCSVQLDVMYVPFRTPQQQMGLKVRGDLRSMVLYSALHDLVEYPYRPIKRCPQCQRIFYSYRKQKYCTQACSVKFRNDQRPNAAERRRQDEEFKRRLAAKRHGRQKK